MFRNTQYVLFAVAVGLFVMAGCSPKAEKIMVSPENIQLTAPDATAQLTAKAVDKNGDEVAGVAITWSSSDAAVAKVDGNGKVSAVGSGSATITAKADALSANVAVTVSLAKKLKLDKETLSLTPDAPEATITATILDEKGQPWAGKGEVKWASADEAIATVDASGKVTGVAAGSTKVTATFKDLSAEAAVESTVGGDEAASGGTKTKKSTKKTKHSVGGKKRVGGGSRHR